MTRSLLLVLVFIAATASPASALNVTYDVVVATPFVGCGANATATSCDAATGPSASGGYGASCKVVNGSVVCSTSDAKSTIGD